MGLEKSDGSEVQKKDGIPGRNHSKNKSINTHNLYTYQ